MKKFALAGAVAALLMGSAGVSNAAVLYNFTPGPANSPTAGYAVIDDFTTGAHITGVGNGFDIMTGTNGNGAQPANDIGGGNYLSVLGGGAADMFFSDFTAKPVSTFEFDWGSTDTYNHIVIHYVDSHGVAGKITVTPGNPDFLEPDGSQVAMDANGLFKVTATAGETFTGLHMYSDSNSFEIDNLAVGVPEPASWALMMVGLGLVGGALRTRAKAVLA
jgi:hypothetical protein